MFRTTPRHAPPRRRQGLMLEGLESRDAPAVLVDPRTMRYTDVDGDIVTVTTSRGAFVDPVLVNDFVFLAAGGREQLQLINLSNDGDEFTGAAITVTAVRGPADGDGRANVGRINATGVDLGAVIVDGDLGRIDAGNAVATTRGVASLVVRSLGRFGTSTQPPAGANLNSIIEGGIGALWVRSDIVGARVSATGGAVARIGSVFVRGSVIGGALDESGRISSSGDIGPVWIRGDIVGGGGSGSGSIVADVDLGQVTVGGSVRGGAHESGRIYATWDMGQVTIRGDLVGGSGDHSGRVEAYSLAGVAVGGSIRGGSDSATGTVFSRQDLGLVSVGHDIIGGTGLVSGRVSASNNITRVTVGGSVLGGGIRAGQALGSVRIRGNLVGTSISPVLITAVGQDSPTETTDVAIGRLTVFGRVEHARILAGYNLIGAPVNEDAQIGAVTVRGDWVASDIAAGATDGLDDEFGTDDDAMIGGGSADINSRIGSITIWGQALGDVSGGNQFGWVAQAIGAVSIGGTMIPLTVGPGNDQVDIGATRGFHLLEL